MGASTTYSLNPSETQTGLDFSHRVLNALKQQGRSKTWLAEQIGISKQAMNYLLKHSTKPKYVVEISSLLNIPVEALLDEVPNNLNLVLNSVGHAQVPVLEFDEISQFIHHPKNFESKKYIQSYPGEAHTRFAVTLNSSSMEPLFPEGTLLVFDQSLSPKNGDYVIARKEGQYFVRKYLHDGNDIYLKAIDPMFKTISDKNIEITGVLVESRIIFK